MSADNIRDPALPYVDESLPEVSGLAGRIRAERGGRLPNLYRALLHTPPLAEGWLTLLTAVRQQASLSPGLRELAVLRVAHLNRSRPEFEAHLRFGSEVGLSPEKLAAVAAWQDSTVFDAGERLALALADAMTASIQLPDHLAAQVAQHFGDRETVELVITIAAYNMTTRFIEALQIDQIAADRPAP
jgi:AhpD family alkylhydroperoxidase